MISKIQKYFNKLKPYQKLLLGLIVGYFIYRYFAKESFENLSLFSKVASWAGIKTPEAMKEIRKQKAEEDEYYRYQEDSEEELTLETLEKVAEGDDYNKYE